MNTTVSKRSFLTYSILNAISFGIYGLIQRNKIATDIETICAGDGQQPAHSFMQTWIFTKLFNLLVFGIFMLPFSIAAAIVLPDIYNVNGFVVLLICFALWLFLAFITESAYIVSWWYTQHNRLVLNSHRFKMVLNDNAFDTAVWKAIINIPMQLFSIFGYAIPLAGFVSFCMFASNRLFIPNAMVYGFLAFFIGIIVGMITLFLKNIINLPLYYTIKSINRFSENMGISYAGAYDPMGLLDEDNKDNIISRTINVLENFGKEKPVVENTTKIDLSQKASVFTENSIKKAPEVPVSAGAIECIAGTNRGYVYTISEGEELIIGKDPKTANIVISAEFKDVSRKHCSVKYYASQYIVTDYSSNGTKVNGAKINPGTPEKVSRGSQIALGKGDNIFKVK